jgi:hypothetical protein
MNSGGWMKTNVGVLMLFMFCIFATLNAMPVLATDAPIENGTSADEGKGESLTEISKKLTNPVSETWSISFQQNNYKIATVSDHDDRWNSNLNFQPVLPIALTKNWNLITRPVVTLFNSTPYPRVTSTGVDIERTIAFGDTIFMLNVSPAPSIAGNWLLGIGPTFIFPTAASDDTGQGKYQVGPAGIVGYLSKEWILAAFVQNWTSFAGDSDRSDVNQMNLQPIAAYFLPHGWSIGYSGNILANWKASSGNVWTVPVGVGISKVVKFGPLPVKIGIGGQWMPIHPDTFGQKWNIQINLSPVIPKLIKGTLF